MIKSIFTFVLIFVINIFSFCSSSILLEKSKLLNDCSLGEIYAEVAACEGDDFDVVIGFEHEFTSDSFKIQGNGISYGHFAYSDLPITLLTLNADCETFYEFVAIDLEDNNCSDFTELGVVCCNNECNLYDLELTPQECHGNNLNLHDLIINFEYENPGNDYFEVWVNQEYSDYYHLSELPLNILIEGSSNEYNHIKVCINDMPDCCIEGEIENPCYEVSNDCNIYDLYAEVTACEEDVFDVLINFEHQNTSDSFRIQGNGINYGYFSYNDLPITLLTLNADCETNYEFIAIDSGDNECSDATGIGEVCCDDDCNLSELVLISQECNADNEHNLVINFEYEYPGNDFFDLWVNQQFIGYYPLSQLPFTIALEGSSNEYNHVRICINDVPDCCIEGEVENPCYEVSEECIIYDLYAEVTACEGDDFDVMINFEYQNTSDSFRIQGNGVNYGYFSYSELPITLTNLSADCETQYEFLIIDPGINYCSDYTELGIVCCESECLISNLALTPLECISEEEYGLIIDFEYENPGNNFFDIWINGEFSGYLLLTQLPITMTIANANNEYDHVSICINDMPDCCIEGEVENPCNEQSNNCLINDINAEVTACEEEMFEVSINFEYENVSDSFRIQGNGVNYGYFAYQDLPIILTGLAANCETNYEFVIIDAEFEECSQATGIGIICCDPATTNELLSDNIDIFIRENKTLVVDLGSINFEKAELNIFNVVGQELMSPTELNNSNNLNLKGILSQSGLIFIQINIQTSKSNYMIIKKVIII